MGSERIDAHPLGGRSVEQAGSVEVDGQTVVASGSGARRDVFDRLDVAVAGVLEAQQSGRRVVQVGPSALDDRRITVDCVSSTHALMTLSILYEPGSIARQRANVSSTKPCTM